jgi:hypothetical protein
MEHSIYQTRIVKQKVKRTGRFTLGHKTVKVAHKLRLVFKCEDNITVAILKKLGKIKNSDEFNAKSGKITRVVDRRLLVQRLQMS